MATYVLLELDGDGGIASDSLAGGGLLDVHTLSKCTSGKDSEDEEGSHVF